MKDRFFTFWDNIKQMLKRMSGSGKTTEKLMTTSTTDQSTKVTHQFGSLPKRTEMFYVHYKDVIGLDWPWKSFSPKEIACKGDGSLLVNYDAMNKLQAFRDALGVPFSPNSAYRSPAHNKAVGGSKNSYHLHGMAFDIPLSNDITREDVHRIAKKAGFTGFGDYNTFVHIDIGGKRYWDGRT